MAILLEDVQSGTPVRDRTGEVIGEVRALYAAGEGNLVEFVLVYWNKRAAQALVPSDDVASVDADGITLMGSQGTYETLAAFDPADNPQIHRL